MKRYERTRALVEGDPTLVHSLVKDVEDELGAKAVRVLDEPREELVMIQVRETAKGTLFYLGEALMTSCRVRVGEVTGLGLVLGSDRSRAYGLAVADAVLSPTTGAVCAARWESRLASELNRIEKRTADDARRCATSCVDFSTMEVEA